MDTAKRISVFRCLFFIFALGVCLFSLQGCAIAPVASPEKEQETGAKYAKQVEQVIGLTVEALCREIAAALKKLPSS